MRDMRLKGVVFQHLKFCTKAALFLVLLFVMGMFFSGCGKKEEKGARQEIDFTVCAREQLPEELFNIIEEKKDKVCKFSYTNGSFMYIVVCYGEREKENLNVVVNDLFMTSNAIYIDTTLKTDQSTSQDAVATGEYSMYPYIVIKCDKYDLPVVYDID